MKQTYFEWHEFDISMITVEYSLQPVLIYQESVVSMMNESEYIVKFQYIVVDHLCSKFHECL